MLVCICVGPYVFLSEHVSYAALQFLLLLQYVNAVTMAVTRAIQFRPEQRPFKVFYYISLPLCPALTVSESEWVSSRISSFLLILTSATLSVPAFFKCPTTADTPLAWNCHHVIYIYMDSTRISCHTLAHECHRAVNLWNTACIATTSMLQLQLHCCFWHLI